VFENVKNSSFHLVSNIFASRERLARMLGGNIENLYDAWNEKLNHLIKPEIVDSGPIVHACNTFLSCLFL
jgi:3-polyprenyl-4-hydroxybenzoate decarboxylase